MISHEIVKVLIVSNLRAHMIMKHEQLVQINQKHQCDIREPNEALSGGYAKFKGFLFGVLIYVGF